VNSSICDLFLSCLYAKQRYNWPSVCQCRTPAGWIFINKPFVGIVVRTQRLGNFGYVSAMLMHIFKYHVTANFTLIELEKKLLNYSISDMLHPCQKLSGLLFSFVFLSQFFPFYNCSNSTIAIFKY